MTGQRLLPTLAAAMAFLGCMGDESRKPMPDTAPVPALYQACDSASQCARVNTSCHDCCDEDAVSRSDSVRYLAHKAGVCVGEQEWVCDCCFLPSQIACVDGRCTYQRLAETCGPGGF